MVTVIPARTAAVPLVIGDMSSVAVPETPPVEVRSCWEPGAGLSELPGPSIVTVPATVSALSYVTVPTKGAAIVIWPSVRVGELVDGKLPVATLKKTGEPATGLIVVFYGGVATLALIMFVLPIAAPPHFGGLTPIIPALDLAPGGDELELGIVLALGLFSFAWFGARREVSSAAR